MEDDPARKHYGFKPREFQRVNPRPVDVSGSHDTSSQSNSKPENTNESAKGTLDVTELNRIASLGGPILFWRTARTPDNDVQLLLKENAKRENAQLADVAAKKRPCVSRRFIDYLFMLALGNSMPGLLALWSAHNENTILFIFCCGGIGFYTAGVTWVMWCIMDRYPR